MFVARRRDEEAVREFQAAIHSPNIGFTRVNYELARALLRLGRPADAVDTLQSSLRGEIDASNLYITRTDLHELLAEAFDRAGQRDSAERITERWSAHGVGRTRGTSRVGTAQSHGSQNTRAR